MVDVSVVRDRLSAYHGTRVPHSVARFVAWLAEDPEHASLLDEGASLLPNYDLAIADAAAPIPVRPISRYQREPPEFMAFAQTGQDGEQIGVLDLAPELERDELPFVTFFPMDMNNEVCLLGDELGIASSTFLAHWSEDEPRSLKLSGLFDRALPRGRWPGLTPPQFSAPKGYRFEQTSDRVGVLAPVDAFGPEETDAELDDFENDIEHAERLLSDGYPASAIAIARGVRADGAEELEFEAACAVWRAAASMLRRPWHVAMVDEVVTSERESRAGRASEVRSYGPYTITNFAFDDGAP